MSLWVDKHRPRSLKKLTYNHSLTKSLESIISDDLPHLLVYGPSGAGKKTRVVALLRDLYGTAVEKLKIDQRVFVTPTNRKLAVNIVSSSYHLELTPTDVGNYDRVVIQELLKDIAQTQQVDVSAKHRFKVVVINEADSLTRDAQSALRRTMEKYSPNLRLILIANSSTKILAPIRSRCLLVRVAAPTQDDIVAVLRNVAQEENLGKIAPGVLEKIATESKRNLRRALLMLEAVYAQKYPMVKRSPYDSGRLDDAKISIVPPDWEVYIQQVADAIVAEQSPQRILQVRTMLYELLTHCIPPTTIIKNLAFALLPKLDEELKPEVIHWAAFYEHRIRLGNKAIFHLEAFVAKGETLTPKNEADRSYEDNCGLLDGVVLKLNGEFYEPQGQGAGGELGLYKFQSWSH